MLAEGPFGALIKRCILATEGAGSARSRFAQTRPRRRLHVPTPPDATCHLGQHPIASRCSRRMTAVGGTLRPGGLRDEPHAAH